MKNEKMTFVLLPLILLTFIGCSEDDANQTVDVEKTVIAEGFFLSNEVIPGQNLLISDQAEWQELLEMLETKHPNITTDISEANLDFADHQVIVVIDEVRPHTGHFINVSNILENQSNLIATVVIGNSESGYTALSQPYEIIKIKKSNKPVIFE